MSGQAQAIISALLPILGFVNGVFMLAAPYKAGTKICKLDPKELKKPQVIDLIQANGAASLGLAVVEGLLFFTDVEYSLAASVAIVPRLFFLLHSMARQTKLGNEFLEPQNAVKIAVLTILLEGRWMNPTLSLQVRGGFYFLLGLLFVLFPGMIAKRSSQIDANPANERLLRAKGKVDIVYGSLVYSLASMPYTTALGAACLVWLCATLYGDFIAKTRDRFRLDAFVQVIIASVSARVLLTSA
ncbi:hypothetical protein ACHAXT_006709 [Thalassiosira profunda]